jgi:hypothetical protein
MDNGTDTPARPGETKDPFPEILEIFYFGQQFIFRILAHTCAPGEKKAYWELGNFFQGGEDSPYIEIDPQGALLAAYEEIAGEHPAH